MTIPETNANRIFSILVAFLLCGAAAQAQTWSLRTEVSTNNAYGGHIIQRIEGNVFTGKFERTKTFIPGTNQTLRITQDSFICRYENGVVSTIGKVPPFEDPRSSVVDYKVLYGDEYISVYFYGSTGFKNSIYRKDKIDGIFKPILEIKNDGLIAFMYDLDNGKVLIGGQMTQAIDKNGIIMPFGNVAIWDISQNMLAPIANDAGIYVSHSIGTDKSLFVLTVNGGFRIAYYGSTDWKNPQYESTPLGVQLRAFCLFNKDLGYGAWRVNTDATFRLVKLDSGAWSVLGTMRGKQTSDFPSYEEMKVNGIERYGDRLIIAHTGTHFNGNPIAPLFSYNIKTGEVQNLPLPGGITTSNFDDAYVKRIGDSLYFVSTHERLSFGRQRMWILTFTQETAWQYTFTGNGNWSNAQNWAYGFKPPETLPVGKTIVINPAGDGECVLDVQQTIQSNAGFQVAPGKRFRVTGDLRVGN